MGCEEIIFRNVTDVDPFNGGLDYGEGVLGVVWRVTEVRVFCQLW